MQPKKYICLKFVKPVQFTRPGTENVMEEKIYIRPASLVCAGAAASHATIRAGNGDGGMATPTGDSYPFGLGHWLGTLGMYRKYQVLKVDWKIHLWAESASTDNQIVFSQHVGDRDRELNWDGNEMTPTFAYQSCAEHIENPWVKTKVVSGHGAGHKQDLWLKGKMSVAKWQRSRGAAADALDNRWDTNPTVHVPYITVYAGRPVGSSSSTVQINGFVSLKTLVKLTDPNTFTDAIPV